MGHRSRLFLLVAFPLTAFSLAACSSPDTPSEGRSPVAVAAPLPSLSSAPLTLDGTIIATHAVDASSSRDPRDLDQIQAMLAEGFGDTAPGPGEAPIRRMLDGSLPPAPGPSAKRLARFAHLADAQLADDESPARLCSVDAPTLTDGAFRPQEAYGCRMLYAAVRTLNAANAASKLDFVLLGGDNVDSAQSNELDWVEGILSGSSRIECDSGLDDDPVPGPANDPKDPFASEGLAVPWLWVTGNHDALFQGINAVADHAADAVGNYAALGTRDWSLPGGPIVKGEVPADDRRALMDRKAMLDKLEADGDGHGVGAEAMALGKAFFSRDIEGTPLRLIVLDTATETGGSGGIIRQGDLEAFIKPALDKAKAEGKWVILASHHTSITMGNGVGFGGDPQPDALDPEAWRAFVGGYSNVIAHIGGHVHKDIVVPIMLPPGGHPYWEMMTTALIDYPHQMRIIEIWDEDNGFLSIRGMPLDFSVEGDALGAEARRLAILDYTAGWTVDRRGDPGDRNVELLIAKP